MSSSRSGVRRPGVPVRVVTARVGDDVAQLAAARRRRVAHDVRDLVRQPERDQLGIEAEALRLRVRLPGEVLEAHEGDAASIDDQLSRVGGADADHQDDVDVTIHCKELAALLLGVACERHHIGALEHRPQIRTRRGDGRSHDVHVVRTVGIDHIIVPVRLEDLAVTVEVALVGGLSVGAIENGEEVG